MKEIGRRGPCASGRLRGLMEKLSPLYYYYVHWISADSSVCVLKRNLLAFFSYSSDRFVSSDLGHLSRDFYALLNRYVTGQFSPDVSVSF